MAKKKKTDIELIKESVKQAIDGLTSLYERLDNFEDKVKKDIEKDFKASLSEVKLAEYLLEKHNSITGDSLAIDKGLEIGNDDFDDLL